MRIFNLQESHFQAIIKQRLSLNQLFLLEKLYLQEEVSGEGRNSSFLLTLRRKGYITENNKVTEAGEQLYKELFKKEKEIKVPKVALEINNLSELHKKLENKLVALTGNKQVRADIQGKRYSFLCNETDLFNRLVKVITKYKLTDFGKIEATLLRYIENCNRKRNWFPLICYYIIKTKEGVETSDMVTDMENIEERIEVRKSKAVDI